MRRWWAELVRAQEVHARRHDVSGREALEAVRRLRWQGGTLVGDVLPGPG